jgi:AraC-like DNA-binding protein
VRNQRESYQLMLDDARQEQALLWHDDDLEGLEILHASYLTHSFARHTHDTFAIGLIEAGAGAFDSRGTTHIARASTIFVIHPDEVHNGYAAAPSGWTYRMLYPDPALFEHFGLEAPRGSHALPFFPHTIIEDTYLHGLLLALHALLEHPSDRLARETTLSLTLSYLVTAHAASPPHPPLVRREQRAVALVKDYLHAYYAEPVSLDQLAAIAQLHPFSLIRAFRTEVGLPPHAYLTQVRINRARHLLRAGMPVAQVAFATGFADQSHLTRHFKHHVGVTPGRYAHPVRNVQDPHL